MLGFHILEALDDTEPRWGMVRLSSWSSYPDDQRTWIAHLPPLPADEAMARLEALRRSERGTASLWGTLRRRLGRARRPEVQLPERRGCREHFLSLVTTAEDFLAGRSLTDQQLVQLLRQQGVWPAEADAALDYGGMYGHWEFVEGIRRLPWQSWVCQRCGSQRVRQVPCARCGRDGCPMCLDCQQLGMIRACSRLLQRPHPLEPPKSVAVQLEFPLTAAQQNASQFLVDFLAASEQKALVWAACGAGKTETVFAAMAKVLRRGGSVLFAIPRRDVVVELQSRLKAAFPGVKQLVLYGGQPWQETAPLTAATTHQVLRYYKRFDLVVLDEVDAFPYHGSEVLRHGLERALKDDGKWIEMTATPVTWPVKQPSTTIPARYHGHPLPVPELLRWQMGPAVDKTFSVPAQLCDGLRAGQPWLVFVPKRQLCEAVAQWLRVHLGLAAGFCHSQSGQRQQLLQELHSGRLSCLVATTVLERGITVPDVQVAVLWADHAVFSDRSLTQMAGRVGRKADNPSGSVFFVAKSFSQAMKDSVAAIRYLNRRAAENGLLKEGVS